MNLVTISDALAHYAPPASRMQLLPGIKFTQIIDDSYNASLIAMRSALETLAALPAKRKVAVLGDMLEIGKYTPEAHEMVGRMAAKDADVLFTVGPRAKFIAEAAREFARIHDSWLQSHGGRCVGNAWESILGRVKGQQFASASSQRLAHRMSAIKQNDIGRRRTKPGFQKRISGLPGPPPARFARLVGDVGFLWFPTRRFATLRCHLCSCGEKPADTIALLLSAVWRPSPTSRDVARGSRRRRAKPRDARRKARNTSLPIPTCAPADCL